MRAPVHRGPAIDSIDVVRPETPFSGGSLECTYALPGVGVRCGGSVTISAPGPFPLAPARSPPAGSPAPCSQPFPRQDLAALAYATPARALFRPDRDPTIMTPLQAHLVCVGLVAADLAARVWRIQWIVQGLGHRLSARDAFVLNAFGDAASALTPLRIGGEPARLAGMLRSQVPAAAAFVALSSSAS